jgi:glycosyltransferase involved in cell wall biosynthesis
VYNAEKYLIKAVESALQLDEVYEVILIEDQSPDNALQICFELAQNMIG